MRFLSFVTLVALMCLPCLALARTATTNSAGAENFVAEGAMLLSQKDKTFILISADGVNTVAPRVINIKAGERIYIRNDDVVAFHNVYDRTARNWVVRKQGPGEMSTAKFDKRGRHHLYCAIHPEVRITVRVQ